MTHHSKQNTPESNIGVDRAVSLTITNPYMRKRQVALKLVLEVTKHHSTTK